MRLTFPLLCLLAFGCAPRTVTPKSSGSIAVSDDDTLLYVADADHDRVTVLDAHTLDVLLHAPVPSRPERLTVARDGAVYVTSKGARAVTRLTRDGWPVAQARVGAEPVGLALDAKGERLYVANSSDGTVTVLDARTLDPLDELEVGGAPWAVAVGADEQLWVTDFLSAQVLEVPRGARHPERTFGLVQQSAGGCRAGPDDAREPAQAADVAVAPDGSRLYVAHVQSRTRAALTSGSLAFAVAPALSTVELSRGETLQEPERQGAFGDPPPADFPATVLATSTDERCNFNGRGTGMDAPSSLVLDALGDWLFVADHNSNAVAVVSTTRRGDERYVSPERGIFGVVRVGARPTGIAISADNRRAWVHNALDYSVSQVELKTSGLAVTREVAFGESDLPADVEAGRRLFYSAVDPRVSQPELGGLSCSSCHPDGRTDGLNWVMGRGVATWGVASRALNTPALWGLERTAPYSWTGSLADLPAFTSHMVAQMGGDGLSRLELEDVSAFLRTVSPPDVAQRAAAPQVAAGEQLFAAQCGSCHGGAALTDGQRHDVAGERLDTPSLLGVAVTGPWLHDGSALALRDALRHPGAPRLSSAELAAVEAWLKGR